MQIFYGSINNNIGYLEGNEVIHASKVLRKRVGDKVFITNGTGDLAEGKILLMTKKSIEIAIESIQSSPKTNHLHIVVAPTKNNDRFEFFLEKATEIGIASITPIVSDRSERKKINPERMNKILVSAMKQSQNFHLPVLHPITSFKDFIIKDSSTAKYIAHCLEDDQKINELKPIDGACTILIGPEGDFTEQEIKTALGNNFKPLSLGKSRLRTETAAIVATHLYTLNNE